jgi:hypothetical protein
MQVDVYAEHHSRANQFQHTKYKRVTINKFFKNSASGNRAMHELNGMHTTTFPQKQISQEKYKLRCESAY